MKWWGRGGGGRGEQSLGASPLNPQFFSYQPYRNSKSTTLSELASRTLLVGRPKSVLKCGGVIDYQRKVVDNRLEWRRLMNSTCECFNEKCIEECNKRRERRRERRSRQLFTKWTLFSCLIFLPVSRVGPYIFLIY